jgi:predicted 3-demethylubiquinone-9 3-methyltransferase (glyoxalase superfamily)
MNNKIYPCLWFDGQAKAAAEFYCSVFDNSKITTDSPMVVAFEICGKKFMGLNGGPVFKINPSISFFVKCKNIEQTNDTWNKLSEGGTALMPIDKYPWSERYGWIKDKYGVTWQVMVNTNSSAIQSITPSMLFTKDVLGRAEEAIRFYTGLFPGSAAGMMAHYPEADANASKLMYAEYNISGYDMVSMDGPGGHDYIFNEGVSLVVDCKDQEEVDYYWNNLTANGGKESMCAWLKDKFGVSWQIVPKALVELMNDKDKEKAGRAMQAMMKMKKIIIADLVKAAEGK